MNENININYDLDYSKDKNIDKRVLEVCAIAEAKFLESLKKKKFKGVPYNEIDVNDLIIQNNQNNIKLNNKYNEIAKTLETSNSNVQNKSYFTGSKLGRIENKSIDYEKNMISQKFFNKNLTNKSPLQNIQKMNTFSISNNQKNFNNNYNKLDENENLINYKNDYNDNNIVKSQEYDYNYNNINNSLNNNNYNNMIKSMNNNLSNNILRLQNDNINNNVKSKNFVLSNGVATNKIQRYSTPKNTKNKIDFNSLNKENNILNKENNILDSFAMNKRRYKPIFSKTINKKYLIDHNIHIKNKNKIELNKILLQAHSFIKNHKYISAYYLLRNTIATGEYHSDLFYLYGEVNRLLKNYENAEDYLLLALNFEIHSPYVFYSMGLLYQNINQYVYSNIFFRLFQRLIDNDNIHFLIAKNYFEIGELLKAAKEVTIAIEMNKENGIYYKLRSDIYDKMGLKEMSNEDLTMYNYIKDLKFEQNK